jgi:hypothetical protein
MLLGMSVSMSVSVGVSVPVSLSMSVSASRKSANFDNVYGSAPGEQYVYLSFEPIFDPC